ncbi:oligosaccharide flippase family protein [Gammaproteobacteria bacterium]|nr:oligosaccharide flippase family protein [Gammaproteobacteria bacterium]
MSISEIGLFALFSLLLSAIFSVTNWSADKYIISQNPLSKPEIDKIFSFELSAAIGFFLIYAIFFHNHFYERLELQNSNFLLFLIGTAFCYHPLSRCKALMEKETNYIMAYSPQLISNIISIVIGYACLFSGLGLWSMVIWKTASYLIELMILFLLLPSIPKFSLSFLSSVPFFSFCWPLFLGGLISFVAVNLDYYLVSTLMGPEQLGLYWMAFSLSSIVLVIRDVIYRLLLPILAKKPSTEERVSIFNNINGAMQIFGVLSSLIVAHFSTFFFSFVLGEKWVEAAPVFVILYFAAVHKLVHGLCAALLLSEMRSKIVFHSALFGLLILGPIVYTAIKIGGLNTVAWGVLLATLIIAIIIHETSVRKLCSAGFSYYSSYLSINLASLYVVTILLSSTDADFPLRILAIVCSICFAVVTLPINSVFKRAKELLR